MKTQLTHIVYIQITFMISSMIWNSSDLKNVGWRYELAKGINATLLADERTVQIYTHFHIFSRKTEENSH